MIDLSFLDKYIPLEMINNITSYLIIIDYKIYFTKHILNRHINRQYISTIKEPHLYSHSIGISPIDNLIDNYEFGIRIHKYTNYYNWFKDLRNPLNN